MENKNVVKSNTASINSNSRSVKPVIQYLVLRFVTCGFIPLQAYIRVRQYSDTSNKFTFIPQFTQLTNAFVCEQHLLLLHQEHKIFTAAVTQI